MAGTSGRWRSSRSCSRSWRRFIPAGVPPGSTPPRPCVMSSAPEVVLACRGLAKTYGLGEVAVPVLKGIDLEVRRGESIAIVGASGSGKSTLLHLLGGLDHPTEGAVALLGQELGALDAEGQGELRNRSLGFVYQFHHLLPEFSALENVAMPLTIRRATRAESHQRAV